MRISGAREVHNNDNRVLYSDHFSRNTITVKIYFAIHALYNITRGEGEWVETKKRERKTRRFRFAIKRACRKFGYAPQVIVRYSSTRTAAITLIISGRPF